jgi:catalase
MPKAFRGKLEAEVARSPALSLLARPGDGGIRTRKVAVFVADGSAAQELRRIHSGLTRQGAVVRIVGPHVGRLRDDAGDAIDADASLENEPGVLFDGLVVVGGDAAAATLAADPRALEHVRDAYRHGKPLLFAGAAHAVWEAAAITAGDDDPSLIMATALTERDVAAYVQALASPRNAQREALLVPPPGPVKAGRRQRGA